jgi:hypothetical protein
MGQGVTVDNRQKYPLLLGKLAVCGRVWHGILAEPEGFEPSIGLYNPITV